MIWNIDNFRNSDGALVRMPKFVSSSEPGSVRVQGIAHL